MLKTLVLVRHGQSAGNVAEKRHFTKNNFFKSEADRKAVGTREDWSIPLTQVGKAQSRQTGKALKELFGAFDLMIHSSYVRAAETAEEILGNYSEEERKAMRVKASFLIREREIGYCFHMTEEEVNRFFPWYINYRRNSEPFIYVPLGGESVLQMASGRLATFLNSLWALDGNQIKVLVVSHGRAILGMRSVLEQWPIETANLKTRVANPPNCSVTAYTFGNSGIPKLEFENKIFYD